MARAYKIVATPVGALKVVASDSGLAALLWEADNPKRVPLGQLVADWAHPVLLEAKRQLQLYFSGTLRSFALPIDAQGISFQKSVWAALMTIPYGETRSYAEIARQIGRPAAARAVGAANGRNPLSIIAPCHRIVGSTGALTGFAGGLATKEFLLRLERSAVRSCS